MKTTKHHYLKFKESFLETVDLFGLKEYQIYFEHVDLKEDAFAQIITDVDSASATVRFNKICDSDAWKHLDPVKSGRHEACHLLLATITWHARSKYITPDMITEAEEKAVNRIMLLLGDD